MYYKIGDRIFNIGSGLTNSGKYGEVINIMGACVYILYDDGEEGSSTDPEKWYKIIKQPIMKNLNNMMKKLLDADTQALVKTEYINGDLELTSKAKEALFSMLYTDKKAELVALAKQEILEAKEEK